MKIDGNELAILQNDLDREGKKEEALKIKLEFLCLLYTSRCV